MAILTDEGIKEALNKRMMDKKYVTCPDCGGTGVNEDRTSGYYLTCETCHGAGILEGKTMDLETVTEEVNEAMNVKVDPTNPDHYKNHTSLECIEEMEIILGDLGVTYFCVGNAWKYIRRWKNKNGVEDLKKAKWYIEKAWELNDGVVMPGGMANLLMRMDDYVNKWIKESEE